MTGSLSHTLPQRLWVVGHQRHMPQLAPGTCLFAVAVHVRTGDRQDRGGVGLLPDHVDHGDVAADPDVAERQAADRPDVVLELARLGALDRPVAGVVDAW